MTRKKKSEEKEEKSMEKRCLNTLISLLSNEVTENDITEKVVFLLQKSQQKKMMQLKLVHQEKKRIHANEVPIIGTIIGVTPGEKHFYSIFQLLFQIHSILFQF